MKNRKVIKRIAASCAAIVTLIGAGLGINSLSKDKETKPEGHTEKSTQVNIEESIGSLEIHFLDVGQGDATLIKCGDAAMLIDAGENDKGSAVWSYLKSQNITKLDYVIGTHPDSDHIGGMDVIVYKFDCANIFMSSYKKETKTYDDVVQAAKSKNYKITNPKLGDTYNLGNAKFTIVAPNDTYEDANNASIGIYLEFGKTSYLFTGDAEYKAEKDIIDSGYNIDADVYKAGHHGSRTSSSDEFLEAVTPKYVVVSCGEDNMYEHPHAAILNYCRIGKIPLYRTDKQGTIVLKSDGENIEWNMAPSY